MANDDTERAVAASAFERKIRRAKWALVFEQFWLRLWIVTGIAGLFGLLSLAGIWPLLHDWVHLGLLGLFAATLLAALVYAVRITWPTREAAIRRIEGVSGIPHRPASSYEDTLTASAENPATMAIWRAHRERMAATLSRLKAGNPQPRTYRHDPFALRALLPLLLVLLLALSGSTAWERMRDAFRFHSAAQLAEARLDAWVTPPSYTSRPPLMLADGATAIGKTAPAQPGATATQVPVRSVVIVRGTGLGSARLALEVSAGGPAHERIKGEEKAAAGGSNGTDVQELRYEIKQPVTIRTLAGNTELASWHLDVIPDAVPKIALTKQPELTPRGSLKLTYKVEDDYGVGSAHVKLEKTKQQAADPDKAWAHVEVPKGARPPLLRPPDLPLTLPKAGGKTAEARTYFEFGSHPWAGIPVTMTLVAKDVAGQTGESEKLAFVLPERRFTKPLARAVVEQRKKLIEDPRWRPQVMKALDAVTMAPDGFFEDSRVYLGLRSVYYRLERDRSRAGMKSVIGQLWDIALRIEDGNLSDAEKALRDAQERLSKALENGASEEELKRLMQEMRQAMKNYMQELAKDSGKDGQQNQDGKDDKNQTLSEQDLEEMLKNMEEMAKNGSREEAQELLSEMRDLMERLQSGKMNEQQAEKNKQMMEMMNELSEMTGEQQKLMDETFKERRGEGEDKSFGKPNMKGSPGGNPEKGEKGKRAQGGKGQQRGAGQKGTPDQGRNGDDGESGEGQENMGQLSQRQRELRDRLSKLQRDMAEKGTGNPDKLDGAKEAMENAEMALRQGDLEEANEQQSQALEQMRENAQSMAQQMMKNMPQKFGQQGDAPRDPLGRPQKSQGPELGTSVKVPDQIDVQKAREILEELRRRLGEATRPPAELDYLERLLRRF